MRAFVVAVVLPIFALGLSACTDSNAYPPDWSPVVTYVSDICPDISGIYAVSDPVIYQALAAHYEKEPRNWSVVQVGGDPQRALRMTLYEANTGEPIEQAVVRTRGSDYECADGELRMRWPGGIPFLSEGEQVPQDELMEKSLAIAKNRAGDLVVRTDLAHWKGISVWCGDGCKYLPIPFTRSTDSRWSRWQATAIPPRRPADANAATTPALSAASVAWNAEQARRIAASRAQSAEEEAVVKLLLPLLPKDMVMTYFSKSDNEFTAELRHKDADRFAQLRDNAEASGHFLAVEVGDFKYTDGYGRHVADVRFSVRP